MRLPHVINYIAGLHAVTQLPDHFITPRLAAFKSIREYTTWNPMSSRKPPPIATYPVRLSGFAATADPNCNKVRPPSNDITRNHDRVFSYLSHIKSCVAVRWPTRQTANEVPDPSATARASASVDGAPARSRKMRRSTRKMREV